MDRSKIVAIVTGAFSILLAVGYLLLVQILDFRGEMIPAPVSFLGSWMYQIVLVIFCGAIA